MIARLLVVDADGGAWLDARFADLAAVLAPGDLVVVNDAATLPASLPARIAGAPAEIRLCAAPDATGRATAVVLGAGDWRTRTEDRPPPPRAPVGTRVDLGPGQLAATVVATSALSPRLVELAADRAGEALWAALYAIGRPVQYAHAAGAYDLWDVQTPYAGRPWAVEMPSAGWSLRWELLAALAARGVAVAAVTHAAGLSATGDAAIDAALPFPEAYEVGPEVVRAITAVHAHGGRVVAIGTSVVRALEGAAAVTGELAPGRGITDLRIGPGFSPRIVDAVVSGIHPEGASHHTLLAAMGGPLVTAATRAALARGYREHEHGDAMLVLATRRRGRAAA